MSGGSSIFPKETVTMIAESLGVTLKDEVASALVQDVEYRLRQVLLEAKKFKTHARRSKLLVQDVNSALKVKNVEPVYGYNSWVRHNWKSTNFQGQQLHFVEDVEVELDDLINGPLPPVPLEVMYTAHWLAIDAVQPAIPQNPTASEISQIKEQAAAKRKAVKDEQNLETSEPGKQTNSSKSAQTKQVLSRELTIYFEKITEAILPHSDVKYQKGALVKSESEYRALALESLSKDPGLQKLVPYFTEFISENISTNLKNLDVLTSLMRTIHSLFINSTLNIEPYLHHVIPSILTCTISKRLSTSPMADHWSLRRFSSTLLGIIIQKYAASYISLQPRLTKTLLKALLDPQKGRGTMYGAIFGLRTMGEQAIRLLIFPNVSFVVATLEEDMQRTSPEEISATAADDDAKVKVLESKRCFEALIVTILPLVKEDLIEKVAGITAAGAQGKIEAADDAALQEAHKFLLDAYGSLAADALFSKLGLQMVDDMMT
ncbi:MAG: hypothetical protein SGCHY_004970 [Lobulomycetales sp.]